MIKYEIDSTGNAQRVRPRILNCPCFTLLRQWLLTVTHYRLF